MGEVDVIASLMVLLALSLWNVLLLVNPSYSGFLDYSPFCRRLLSICTIVYTRYRALVVIHT